MKTNRAVAKYVTEVTVKDPDTGGDVVVEIWKDTESGGIFGVEAEFLDQEQPESISSPFNAGTYLVIPEAEVDPK
jgi:hypothetical protein